MCTMRREGELLLLVNGLERFIDQLALEQRSWEYVRKAIWVIWQPVYDLKVGAQKLDLLRGRLQQISRRLNAWRANSRSEPALKWKSTLDTNVRALSSIAGEIRRLGELGDQASPITMLSFKMVTGQNA